MCNEKTVIFTTRCDTYVGKIVAKKVSGKYLIKYYDHNIKQYKFITKRKNTVKEI